MGELKVGAGMQQEGGAEIGGGKGKGEVAAG